jgi:hypothetical protein
LGAHGVLDTFVGWNYVGWLGRSLHSRQHPLVLHLAVFVGVACFWLHHPRMRYDAKVAIVALLLVLLFMAVLSFFG